MDCLPGRPAGSVHSAPNGHLCTSATQTATVILRTVCSRCGPATGTDSRCRLGPPEVPRSWSHSAPLLSPLPRCPSALTPGRALVLIPCSQQERKGWCRLCPLHVLQEWRRQQIQDYIIDELKPYYLVAFIFACITFLFLIGYLIWYGDHITELLPQHRLGRHSLAYHQNTPWTNHVSYLPRQSHRSGQMNRRGA